MAEEEAPAPALDSASDMESKVRTAMVSRIPYFKEQADSLTFEGVRRLLEKDLGLDSYALDVHKRFVKQCLKECLESGNEDECPKNSGDAVETISSVEGQSVDQDEQRKEVNEPNSEDSMEASPEMELMAGHEKSKTETVATDEVENLTAPSEAIIKKAILKRASYIRKNSENIAMVGVRRLIEEDLKIDKFALDSYKKLISEQVNEVLTNPQVSKSATNNKAVAKKTIPKKSSQPVLSASSESGSEVEEDEVKPRKKSTPKAKSHSLSGLKKHKQYDEDVREPKRKKSKASKVKSEENNEDEDDGDGSEQENTELSAEKPVKRKEVPKSSYGKRVENLKSIIKSCSMSIPPSIYKKVKQAPENKREAVLIKELENILAKEGLTANPSEKEIKDVKKKKERAKELEGIDMNNIVSSSRRRSTFSFAPPPKPEIPDTSDADSGDSEDENEDDDDDDDNEVEVDEEQDEEDGDGSKSQDEGDDNGGSD
ncbi:hypothetical protein V2J09_008510 [Rumex salicifolius]